MKLNSLSLVAALASCAPSCVTADEPPPTVHLDLASVPEQDRESVTAAARAWETCGVTPVDREDADIVVTVYPPGSDRPLSGWGRADMETGEIVLWTALGDQTSKVMAHELGHLVIPTTQHMDGAGAMESPIRANGWHGLTQADRDFACETGGLCCE